MAPPPSLNIRNTPISHKNLEEQIIANQFSDLVSEFMKTHLQGLVHDSTLGIYRKLLEWIDIQKNRILYENCAKYSEMENIIFKEQSQSYFCQARKRKVKQDVKSFLERESKLQKIEKTPKNVFFSDPYIFSLVLDHFTLDELLQIRTCCRYIYNIIQNFGSYIVRNFKIRFHIEYCPATKHIYSVTEPICKKKCLIAATAKEALNYNCLLKRREMSDNKHNEFTELFVKSMFSFKSSTLIDMKLCPALSSNSTITCPIEKLQGFTIIRNFSLPLSESNTIADEFNNQYIYYVNQFVRNSYSTVNECLNNNVISLLKYILMHHRKN